MTNISKSPTDEIVYKAGEYTGRDQKKRNRYEAIGAAWRDADGNINRVKISSIPLAWDGNLYFRSRQGKGEEGGAA